MLLRQKILLAFLDSLKAPVGGDVLVMLAFFYRHEKDSGEESTFYDFVPRERGPFSFTLDHELDKLGRDGYVTAGEESIALCEQAAGAADGKIGELPAGVRDSVAEIVGRYGGKSREKLLKDVCSRYPWYATRIEPAGSKPKSAARTRKAKAAVYTVGYEGRSLDAFFNHLLEEGIELIIDVRANPLSRRYGFSKKQFSKIAEQLRVGYHHVPALGISSKHRTDLTDFDSYQRLLRMYEEEMLPQHGAEVDEVGVLMSKTPAALLCMEQDVRCCHRGRLAEAVARRTGLEVKHI